MSLEIQYAADTTLSRSHSKELLVLRKFMQIFKWFF